MPKKKGGIGLHTTGITRRRFEPNLQKIRVRHGGGVTRKLVCATCIKDTDIIFDCPHCGKSLAIDYRGAGLSIPCTDCGRIVEVPIPEGMELSDIDSSEEEQEIRILNLRKSLAASAYRVSQLETELESMTTRHGVLEASRSEASFRFGKIIEKIGFIEASLREIGKALEDINQIVRKDL